MRDQYETLLAEPVGGHILVVTMNRPAVRNAMNTQMGLDLKALFESLYVATQIDRHNGYQFELEAYNQLVGTEDRLEGVRAFNEKRKPDFKGR